MALADVRRAEVRRADAGKTLGAVLVAGLVVGAGYLILLGQALDSSS